MNSLTTPSKRDTSKLSSHPIVEEDGGTVTPRRCILTRRRARTSNGSHSTLESSSRKSGTGKGALVLSVSFTRKKPTSDFMGAHGTLLTKMWDKPARVSTSLTDEARRFSATAKPFSRTKDTKIS